MINAVIGTAIALALFAIGGAYARRWEKR